MGLCHSFWGFYFYFKDLLGNRRALHQHCLWGFAFSRQGHQPKPYSWFFSGISRLTFRGIDTPISIAFARGCRTVFSGQNLAQSGRDFRSKITLENFCSQSLRNVLLVCTNMRVCVRIALCHPVVRGDISCRY